MNRRDFLIRSAIMTAAISSNVSAVDHYKDTSITTVKKNSSRTISFFVFPGMTALDFIGPLTALSYGGFNINYVWHDKEPLDTESNGIKIYPTATFNEMRSSDVLCVPGTSNPFDIINDHKAMQWLNYVGSRAEYVTSICTGSIILAAAGLLNGYRAATHWSMEKQLEMLGATVVRDRVVTDRNRITGGGVTAGIDFGLTLLSTLMDEDNAKLSQLIMQYEPAPPFNAGSPIHAGKELTDRAAEIIWENVSSNTPDYMSNLIKAKNRKF